MWQDVYLFQNAKLISSIISSTGNIFLYDNISGRKRKKTLSDITYFTSQSFHKHADAIYEP